MSKYLKPLDEFVTVQTLTNNREVGILKCKSCKAMFAVYRFSDYSKDVCYCPYCGQTANPAWKKGKDNDGDQDI